MKRFGLISLLLCCHMLLFSKDRSDGRFTFGAEWSYIANIHTGYHYNFFAPEGFRVNPVGNGFGFSSNAEAYLHAGYDFNDKWNLSLYVGYAGIERYHHAVPVSLRATRFFDRNKASDRWFCTGAGAPVLKASLSLRDEIQFDSALCERNHLMRMREKRCASDSGILYIELLGEIRKVSRHLANIAQRS